MGPIPDQVTSSSLWRRLAPSAMLDAMWWTLFRGAHWSELSDLVSPSLFEVMGMGDLMSQLRSLASGYWERERWASLREERSKALSQSGLPIELSHTRIGRFTRHEDGDEILTLYFYQLFTENCTLLDLRRSSFRVGDRLNWDPAAVCMDWDRDFLGALREVYTGFYCDDEARYRAGLSALGLERASDAFFKQFHSAHGGRLTFSLGDFRRSFHDVFARCRDTHTQLHPNFVALGVYLACLYEHLEALGGSFDVRAAFLRGSSLA